MELERIIIVEGLTDKRQVEKIITDEVTVICTNGTLGVERFDELLETYELDYKQVYIFVDEDKSGMQLRKQLTRELPHAKHIHTTTDYREVAETPAHTLAMALLRSDFNINPIFLKGD